ncbi:MAG: acyl-ACP--UDP-N-acetylglucosamine O-acyltransferase [Planctomycetes bacterium]|nr:acyl-ACP--UDP-N-acetylglucosamine O-acyltransferase [Planctomycetota bacterium]NQU47634.1 acyl-ACP--UDP-N-acetylglucosamine O-acyltransferase [Planctomycetota bacterium]
MSSVHPTAFVAPGAELDSSVVVGPFCYVGSRTKIGPGTILGPHVTVQGHTTIGERNHFVGQCAIGGMPQDLKYTGEESALVIGNDNVVREFVTINIGTAAGSWVTSLGDNNLIMACAHVAHDCVIEDNVIIGNNVLLAGHVRIENNAIISGGAAVNHYVTIGKQAMVGGMSRVVKDVPPFMTIEGSPARVRGVNVIGLKRSNTPTETVRQLRAAFRKLFQDDTPSALVLDEIEAVESLTPEVLRLVSFLRDMEKGYQGRYREALRRPPQADD